MIEKFKHLLVGKLLPYFSFLISGIPVFRFISNSLINSFVESSLYQSLNFFFRPYIIE